MRARSCVRAHQEAGQSLASEAPPPRDSALGFRTGTVGAQDSSCSRPLASDCIRDGIGHGGPWDRLHGEGRSLLWEPRGAVSLDP